MVTSSTSSANEMPQYSLVSGEITGSNLGRLVTPVFCSLLVFRRLSSGRHPVGLNHSRTLSHQLRV
ncbi:hypothetical protein PsW74_05003 [Pseudovibrio sp. W74]|nr:hypothetical protein PsW74_05003 [Pseudovibrio sp. W74]